jgi:hypothetical protein
MPQANLSWFLIFAAAGTSVAQAGVIVSTFSTTPPGYVGDSDQISAFTSMFGPTGVDWAMQFLVPAGGSYQFSGYRVAIESRGTPTTVSFTVASDTSNTPGAALETIPMSVPSSSASILTGTSILRPTLLAGTKYWLEASISSTALNTEALWNTPTPLRTSPPTGLVADWNFPFSATWFVQSGVQTAFEIDGTQSSAAVPEPSTAECAMLGGLVICWFIVRRRAAILLPPFTVERKSSPRCSW